MELLNNAIKYAADAHGTATRKNKTRPYILHPLEAMLIVSRLTDDEEILAATVLHDTIEDAKKTKSEIEELFGKRVADLVAAESENKREGQSETETWQTRKQETIDHLKKAGRDVKLICLGDKLSNIREIAIDYRIVGDSIWERFNQKDPKMHAWYYLSILDILAEGFGDIPEIREYKALVDEVFK